MNTYEAHVGGAGIETMQTKDLGEVAWILQSFPVSTITQPSQWKYDICTGFCWQQGYVLQPLNTSLAHPCIAQVLSCSLLLYVSFCKAIIVHCLLESRADEVSFSLCQCLFLPCCVRLPPTSHRNIQPTYWKWQSCNAMEIFTAMFKTQAARRETRPHHSGKVCCLPLKVENARQQESEAPPSRTQSHFQFQSWKGCWEKAFEGEIHRSWNKQHFIFKAKSSYATQFHANVHLRLISLIAGIPI